MSVVGGILWKPKRVRRVLGLRGLAARSTSMTITVADTLQVGATALIITSGATMLLYVIGRSIANALHLFV